jgi:hypothetical protein
MPLSQLYVSRNWPLLWHLQLTFKKLHLGHHVTNQFIIHREVQALVIGVAQFDTNHLAWEAMPMQKWQWHKELKVA